MAVSEKINIYVPEEIGRILERDKQMFEIYKPNGNGFNTNRFLTMLILGYYDTYVEETKSIYDRVMAALNKSDTPHLSNESLAHAVVDAIYNSEQPRRGGKGSTHLSLKPTERTETLILRIIQNTYDYLSQYFRRMLISYCEKPFSQREQIVFKETYDLLKDCCKNHQPIYFTTIWNDKYIHEVVPFSVSTGPEEMFNYLTCQEENKKTHLYEARTYALRRIKHVNISDSKQDIHPDVREHLKLMLQYGPQYAINDDEEICVKLSAAGKDTYMRVYFGRPTVHRIEDREDGYYYYYRCSKEQVFLYFKRFSPEMAEILSPAALRNRMREFHEKAFEVYELGS